MYIIQILKHGEVIYRNEVDYIVYNSFNDYYTQEQYEEIICPNFANFENHLMIKFESDDDPILEIISKEFEDYVLKAFEEFPLNLWYTKKYTGNQMEYLRKSSDIKYKDIYSVFIQFKTFTIRVKYKITFNKAELLYTESDNLDKAYKYFDLEGFEKSLNVMLFDMKKKFLKEKQELADSRNERLKKLQSLADDILFLMDNDSDFENEIIDRIIDHSKFTDYIEDSNYELRNYCDTEVRDRIKDERDRYIGY